MPDDNFPDVDKAADAVEEGLQELIEDLETVQESIERVQEERNTLTEDIETARAEQEEYRAVANKSATKQEAGQYATMAERANRRARTLTQRSDQLKHRLMELKQERESLAMEIAATGAALPQEVQESFEE